MKAKIIGFTQKDGQDWDCQCVTDKGEHILVDPFVGCSWRYEDRKVLLNQWFEDDDVFLSDDKTIYFTSEKGFKLITPYSMNQNKSCCPNCIKMSNVDGKPYCSFQPCSCHHTPKEAVSEEKPYSLNTKKATMEVSLENDRLYIRLLGNQAVYTKIDVNFDLFIYFHCNIKPHCSFFWEHGKIR